MIPPATQEELRSRLTDLVSGLYEEVHARLEQMAAVLEAAARAMDWSDAVRAIPVAGSWLGRLTVDDTQRAIDRFNDEIQPQVWAAVEGLARDLESVVDSLAADPGGLRALAWGYADCRRVLLVPGPSVEQELLALGRHWSGPAFRAYRLVASEQDAALGAIATAMDAAATRTVEAAERILRLWADLVAGLEGFLVQVVRVLAEATSVETILSFEVPSVISAVADVLAFAQEIAQSLERYMLEESFGASLGWRQLTNGSAGLPGNVWPRVHPGVAAGLDQTRSWAPG